MTKYVSKKNNVRTKTSTKKPRAKRFRVKSMPSKDKNGKRINLPPRMRDASWKRINGCLLYTSPSPRDRTRSRMPSSA